MKDVEECTRRSVMVECDIPGNYTVTRKMSGVKLLVFNRLKLDNFVSIPKELMPQLEVIIVKYSWILVCFNIEVDQSDHIRGCINCPSILHTKFDSLLSLKFWYNGCFYICHVFTVRTVCENIMDAINSVEDQCVLLDPISWLFCNITSR